LDIAKEGLEIKILERLDEPGLTKRYVQAFTGGFARSSSVAALNIAMA